MSVSQFGAARALQSHLAKADAAVTCDEGMVLADLSLRVVAIDAGAIAILGRVFGGRESWDATLRLPAVLVSQILSHENDEWNGLQLCLPGSGNYACTVHLVEPPQNTCDRSMVALHLHRESSASDSIAQLVKECSLTPREGQVLTAISAGLTSKEVALRMGISPNTVKTYIRLIMVKLGVGTRAAIVGRLLRRQSRQEGAL